MAQLPAPLPLNCTVCPKQPTFSDVSHLLTHVSSKGHLARYYNLKIRAAQDDSARSIIEQYDQWYAGNNVEQLMSARMQSKDRKRPRARVQATQSRPPVKRKQYTQTEALDPALGLPPADTLFERYDTLSLPHNPYDLSLFDANIKSRLPRLYLWATNQPGSYHAVPLEHLTPSRATYNAVRSAPFAPMTPQIALNPGNYYLDDSTEATRLKGICWPGMDIFDAATPETKRKRNQKKAVSVTESLEKTALATEPNEMIFTPRGTLRKLQFITGQPSQDSSPYKLDIPSPKLKRPKTRRPLAEKDGNVPILPNNQPDVVPFRGFDSLSGTPSGDRLPKIRKREFRVLDERKETQPSVFGHPSGMRLLTSALHYPPMLNGQLPNHVPNSANVTTRNRTPYSDYQPAQLTMPYYGYGYGYSYFGVPHMDVSGFLAFPQALPQSRPPGRRSNSNVTEEQIDVFKTIESDDFEVKTEDNDENDNDDDCDDEDGEDDLFNNGDAPDDEHPLTTETMNIQFDFDDCSQEL